MKISIIHPSRGRSYKSWSNIVKWIGLKYEDNIELIVSLDKDDNHLDDYILAYDDIGPIIIINNNKSAIDAINAGAKVATGDILIVVSDDTDCFPGWDISLLKAVEGKEDFLLKCKDGTQGYIVTMPVMDRKYYERFGYIYYPEYKHMFCDTELTCVADMLGRLIKCNLMFEHKHYSYTGEKRDDLHVRNDNTWKQGEDLFISRAKKNFGLAPDQIKQGITDYAMRNFIKIKS